VDGTNPLFISERYDEKQKKTSVNIIGLFTLGFHHQHDCPELKRMLTDSGISVNVVIPEGGEIAQRKDLPKACGNIVLYREAGRMSAERAAAAWVDGTNPLFIRERYDATDMHSFVLPVF